MFFKVLVTAVCFLILANVFERFRKRQIRLSLFALWSFIWIAVVVATYWPGSTDYAAHLFGVGRGLDLVLFLSIVAIFYGMYRIYAKLEKAERKITQLVREEALKKARSSLD